MLPDKQVWTATISAAIAEAEVILNKAKAEPTKFIRPEIGVWGGKYVSSRYQNIFNTQDRGKLDLLEQDAVSQFHTEFKGIVIEGPKPGELDATADDVQKLLDELKVELAPAKLSEEYELYQQCIIKRDPILGKETFLKLFRGALLGLIKLHNTMLQIMPQGEKPPLVAPPGSHIKHTSFGDQIVKDAPSTLPDDQTLLGQITVGQYKALYKALMGK